MIRLPVAGLSPSDPSLLMAAGVTVGQKVLEVAAGTEALAGMAAAQVGVSGRVVVADLSLPMLRQRPWRIHIVLNGY